MNALEQLDRLRREAVERARHAQLEARSAQQQAEAALKAALDGERQAERQLARARADYGAASSVLDLRAAELQLAYTRQAQVAAHTLSVRCERAHARARAALAEQEKRLLEAELGRRAVERRLTQQAADVGRRTERRHEDEAEDAFRATRTR
ncbi:MAG TPA: hypothetical protein VFX59_00920 [Polyangiales bacterium]|nr:hypothetical protein [Polyangiales bacterium]